MESHEKLLSIGEVAALLDVPRWRLAYWIERGAVSGPSIVVPGRRLFTARDIAQIRKELASRECAGREAVGTGGQEVRR